MNFKEEVAEHTRKIEVLIKKYLPREEGFCVKLAEAINYNMLAGGKRLRPMLMEETYRMFGGTGKVIEPFMVSMEMIHTHSLIHDDLPALDNDEYRRGRKTTHVVYGEAAAILAGDTLLNYAYETAFLGFQMDTAADIVGKALGILGQKTGICGMLGGQSVDVENDGKMLTEDMLSFIYANKTSALIQASMMIGAVLAQASRQEVEQMESIGHDIGLAFQIQDDILDVTSTTKELGKPVLSDEKNHKTTYVTLKGIEQAKKEVEKLTDQAVERLGTLPGNKEFLSALLQSLCYRRK